MNFRKAQKIDFKYLCECKKDAYRFPEEYLEAYESNMFFPDKCVVCEENGGISSYIQSCDYGIAVGRKTITVRYINDAYTIPSKRRMGYMKDGIKNILGAMNAEKVPFVFCVPFDRRIFDSLGFRIVSDIKEYRITADDIPAYKISGDVKMIRRPDESMINGISSVYESYMKRKETPRFYALRANIHQYKMIDNFTENYGGGFAAFYDPAGELSGYVMYMIENKLLNVYEYAYKDAAAYKSVFAFLKNHKYQAEKIIIKTSADDAAYTDFSGGETRLIPFAAARAANIEEVLRLFADRLDGINIRIFDPMIGMNSGTWSVSAGSVMPTSEEYDFETDEGTFTQMCLGYISAEDAMYMGYMKKATGDSGKVAAMRDAFKKGDNYINMLL
ncbi:MAG: GNAT family N-acetyltransferase [Oscillospiraceae bacterium]|nr:GNAT family N-acetyltransferase [Oscillospiraceae bacterium]